ncbi:ABC transporter substrate-binding protein [Xylophilus sp. GOD-11R]|uniref:ABC transporter substrate-binding protein n=1 Tax=Xylophilus sp. GOD-11R TaxID=3089814 RepID=UPI00298BF80C|nr:ABC transporter substrate-binding protein [Xylophilus sp. GOD-11R]WPB59210.1 ABC transporter substrate-binding protein [Xylophilus sp. GOD-11R]
MNLHPPPSRRRRQTLIATASLLQPFARAAAAEDPGNPLLLPALATATSQLSIVGSTDLPVFAPVLRDYQRLAPGVAIRYEEFSTQGLFRQATRTGTPGGADLLVSSSMDLQVQLANDGHTLPHQSAETAALPPWARWRDEVFGFSAEPLVIAYDARRFTPATAPATRRQLLQMLRDPARPLDRRVGSYDLAVSGIGYLAATQDARFDDNAGALLAAMADNHAHWVGHAGTLLDGIERGELALGYNVPGAYVQARIAAGAPIGMVMPKEYTLLISRTALVPRTAPNPEQARRFLDYLLSARGQGVLEQQAHILPIRAEIGLGAPPAGALRPVPLGPGLLVYQDRLKRTRFLEAWRALLPHAG